MTPRDAIFTLTGLGVALAIASSLAEVRPILVWNPTASASRGLYRIAPPSGLQAGDLVLLRPDPASAAIYAERGYLSVWVSCEAHWRGACAYASTPVKWRSMIAVADALPIDGRGRPMTPWAGCRTLRDGELFVAQCRCARLARGRYFGPSLVSSVIGRAVPVWTEKER
jgi:type IV secretory pathway protease TraF